MISLSLACLSTYFVEIPFTRFSQSSANRVVFFGFLGAILSTLGVSQIFDQRDLITLSTVNKNRHDWYAEAPLHNGNNKQTKTCRETQAGPAQNKHTKRKQRTTHSSEAPHKGTKANNTDLPSPAHGAKDPHPGPKRNLRAAGPGKKQTARPGGAPPLWSKGRQPGTRHA